MKYISSSMLAIFLQAWIFGQDHVIFRHHAKIC